MKKQLELDDSTARRLYATASAEFKTMLEENFGKDFFTEKITDRVRDYRDILNISGVKATDDEIKVVGFDDEENAVVSNLIRKMRTVKVYNEGYKFKRGDKRHYPYYNVSSGFVFSCTTYVSTHAGTTSAPRLAFKDDTLCRDYAKKFEHIEKGIIEF
ncbi:MAG: hypothetical protein AAB966_00815 [Patescibacteria group bacterium]